ncbi:hypothetical protein, partial [Escherichia coli]
LQFADTVAGMEDFAQGMLRPTAAGQQCVQVHMPGRLGSTGRYSGLAFPDPTCVEQRTQRYAIASSGDGCGWGDVGYG